MSDALRYFALPPEACPDVARDVPHVAHVHTPEGGTKSVCRGLLPHSVPTAEHYEVPFHGAEGTVCAACHDWWPCETVAPRDTDDVPAQADQARP